MTRSENNSGGFFLLTAGFSPALKTQNDGSRFNGFVCSADGKSPGFSPVLMRDFAR
jgi:hypothetical protein